MWSKQPNEVQTKFQNGDKANLNGTERDMFVPIYINFPTKPSSRFTENGPKKETMHWVTVLGVDVSSRRR